MIALDTVALTCPKCGCAHDTATAECPRCGVVLAKYARLHPRVGTDPLPVAADGGTLYDPAVHAAALAAERAREQSRETQRDVAAARRDYRARLIGLPLALGLGWLAVHTSPALVRMLAMWVHESGHAIAAWLSGYMAFPGPWMTPVGSVRSYTVTAAVGGWLLFGLYRAWKAERALWIAAAVAALTVMLVCTFALSETQAEQLILFAGDGGNFVLGGLLMLTMYATADHPIRKDNVCWGLLGIGALAYMDGFRVWMGPVEALPFGESTNGVSDASMLAEVYGWSIPLIVNRYQHLAFAVLAVLAVIYLAGVLSGARAPKNGMLD